VTDGSYYPARRGIILSVRPNSHQFSFLPSIQGLVAYYTESRKTWQEVGVGYVSRRGNPLNSDLDEPEDPDIYDEDDTPVPEDD